MCINLMDLVKNVETILYHIAFILYPQITINRQRMKQITEKHRCSVIMYSLQTPHLNGWSGFLLQHMSLVRILSTQLV